VLQYSGEPETAWQVPGITIGLKIPNLGINIPKLGITISVMAVNTPLEHSRQKHDAVHRGSALASALFTSTQQRVLALLFGQPDRSFFVTELVSLADSGSGAVQRELVRLAQSRLVIVTRIGNQKHYQANKDSPLFGELCSIIRKTVGLQETVRVALEPLNKKISLALIYGSVANQSDTAASDIDILLVSNNLTLEEVYTALASAERQLDRRVSPTLYTVNEFKQRQKSRNSFLTRVLDGQTVILIGSIDGE
jgi:predicted nucleotidyltransferase